MRLVCGSVSSSSKTTPSFPFGKVLKSNTARALRRAQLTEPQKERVRHRVFSLLRAGHVPHEFREYAKLVRKIGFSADDVPVVGSPDRHVERFRRYFADVAATAAGPVT